MAYQWVEITQDFDRTLPFTNVRWDLSKCAAWATQGGNTANGALSEVPGINTDGLGWSTVSGATYGYAGQNRFTLRAPSGTANGFVFSCRAQGFKDRSITFYATQITTDVYEYTYPVTLYWGGIGVSTAPYSAQEGTGVFVYVDAPTFETDVTAITASYSSTTSAVTLTAAEGMAWTASTLNNWITLSTTGGTGSSVFTVSVAANKAYTARNGLVTLTNGEDVIEITVEQEKYPLLIPNNNIYRGGNRIN